MNASVAAVRPSLAAPRWGTVVALAAALTPLAVRAALPGGLEANEASDYRDFYAPVARSIVAGHGLVVGGGPAIAYPPGYPLLLAGVSIVCRALHVPDDAGLAALAMLASSLAATFLFRLARDVWGTERALVAVAAWLSYPLALWLTKQPNSEVPFTAVLWAAVLVFWTALRRERPGVGLCIAAGATAGGAMLVRSIAIGIVPLLVAVLAIRRRDLGPRTRAALGLALVAGNLLVAGPWLGWVWTRTGRIIPLATSGLPSVQDGLTFGAGSKSYRDASAVPEDVRALMIRLRAREGEMTSLRALARVVGAEARPAPAAALHLLALKIGRSWYGTDSGRHEGLVRAVQILWMGVALAALARAAQQPGAPGALAFVVAALVVYFWAMTAIVLSVVRYMVPATGLLFALVPAFLPSRRVAHPSR